MTRTLSCISGRRQQFLGDFHGYGGIPAGSYSVRTESIHPGASAAPERIRVSADDTPRIRITLPKITSVILEFDAVRHMGYI